MYGELKLTLSNVLQIAGSATFQESLWASLEHNGGFFESSRSGTK